MASIGQSTAEPWAGELLCVWNITGLAHKLVPKSNQNEDIEKTLLLLDKLKSSSRSPDNF